MSLATDIEKRIDFPSGVDVNYRETTTWYDGTPITDEKCDGVIYRKNDNIYYRKTIANDFIPKVNDINSLRNYNGYFEGQDIILLGYYSAGDKEPLKYKFTVSNFSTLTDDGGSVIKTNKGSWIAQFNGVINALDFGLRANYDPITNTGTDNSSVFQKMFAVASPVYELPEGFILLNSHIKIPNGVTITGHNTKIRRGTSTGSSTGVLYQLSSSDSEIVEGSTIEGISFYGGVTTTNHNQWTHLYSVAGTKNAVIRNCKFYGFRGDGILISSGPANIDRRRNQNVIVEKCYFNGDVLNNRNGISIIMCDDTLIEDCLFENIGAPTLSQSVGAIDCERNNINEQQTNNVRIINNIFRDIVTTNTCGVALFCFGDNVSSGIPSSKNHEVRGNRFINCYWGISTPEQKLDISNNQTPTGLNIDSNFFINNVKAIQLWANSNVNITKNHFYGIYEQGKYCSIELSGDTEVLRTARNIKITQNNFYKTGRNASIDITSVEGLVISDNVCASNRPFIQQSIDSVSMGNSRVLSGIKVFRNKFESLVNTGTALRLYQVASGANNARSILINSSCEMYDNEIVGNAVLSNIVNSVFNKMVFESHITAAMLTGTWKAGCFVETQLNNYNYRIKCSVSGTSPLSETITVDATNGSNILNISSAITTQIRKGMYLLIGDDSSVKEVIDVYGDTILLKTAYAGTTNAMASVSSSPPQFVNEPITNYIRTVGTNTNLNLGKGEETLIFTGGGTGISLITTDVNGFANAIKRYKNNKTGILEVKPNPSSPGITLNGSNTNSILIDPGKSLTIISTAADTWITLDFINNATTTLFGLVKQSSAVADITASDSSSVVLSDLIAMTSPDLTNISTADLANVTTADVGVVTSDNATDLASVIALANELKSKFNLGVPLTNEIKLKYNLNTSITNEIKLKYNTNVTFGNEIKTKYALSIALSNDIKSKYNIVSTLSNSTKSRVNLKLVADRNSGQQI